MEWDSAQKTFQKFVKDARVAQTAKKFRHAVIAAGDFISRKTS